MKKSKTILFTLSVVSMMAFMAGCDNSGSNSSSVEENSSEFISDVSSNEVVSSEESSSSESSQESSSQEPSVVEVEKKFGISIDAAEGTSVEIVDEQETYSAGTSVSFVVNVSKDNLDLDYVTYDDNVVSMDSNGKYNIVVRNKNAIIKTFVVNRGDDNLLDVSDVDEENVPKTIEDFKTALENAKEKEAMYCNSASLDSTYDETRNATASMGYNNVVHVSGHKLSSSSSSFKSYFGYEKGIYENKFYDIQDSAQTVDLTKKMTIKTIVANDSENVLSSQITEKEAYIEANTSGFIDEVIAKTFKSNSYGFLATDNYGWKEIGYSYNVSSDGKSYFAKASAYYSSYKRVIEFVSEIDGDGFLKSANLTLKDYNSDDIVEDKTDPENVYHYASEGAEPKKEQKFTVNFNRAYRNKLDKTDLSDKVSYDYDVVVNYKIPGDTMKTVGDDNTVYVSSELSFYFRQKELNPIFVVPTLIGSKEEGFITFNDSGKPVVSKEGDFTLLFDNGLGEIKEVPVYSDVPEAKSVTASLDSNKIYNGSSATLTTVINPSGAYQDVEVTLKDDSTCTVEINKNDDGTFDIKGLTNGEGVLIVTCSNNPSITTNVSFTVEDKPNVDNIKAFLTTNTLFGKTSGWGNHFVNFNTDGNGEYVCYEGGKGDVIPFTWELNEDTLVITIDVDGSLKSKYYNVGCFSELTESSVKFTYYYSGSAKYVTLTALTEKLDFASEDLNLGQYK